MEIELDAEEMVSAIMEDDSALDTLIDRLADHMADRIDSSTREAVREGFDYHHDHFRMSWMRMMEAELSDLTSSTREGRNGEPLACAHGQQMYDGIFHAIRQYVGGEGNGKMREMLGIGDDLVTTLTELVNAAVNEAVETTVQARLKNVTSYGLTVDARPIMAKIGAPQPAFGGYVSPAHTDEDVDEFSRGDLVICDAASDPHLWAPSCNDHNARRATDEFGNPLVSNISDE